MPYGMTFFHYDEPDTELIPRVDIGHIRYFVGSYRNANAVYFEPDLVEKQIWNYNNPDIPLFEFCYLEAGLYQGDVLTMLGSRGENLGHCYLCPEYSTVYKKFEDFNSELVPYILDYFTIEQLEYVYSLHMRWVEPRTHNEDYYPENLSANTAENAFDDFNIELYVGRDSLIYKNWRDWQNARTDYFNKLDVNTLLDYYQVTELTVYTYFEWATYYEKDPLGNKFLRWYVDSTFSLIDFTLRFKKIGNYTNSDLLSIYGSSFYQNDGFLGLTKLSSIIASVHYSSIISKYRELDFIFDSPLGAHVTINDRDSLWVSGSIAMVYRFKFGIFLIFPSYIKEDIIQVKNQIGKTYDDEGNSIPIYEYFTSYEYSSKEVDKEVFTFYFWSNPYFNYDYEKELPPSYTVPLPQEPKKCCIAECFGITE